MARQQDDISLRLGYWFAVHRDQLRTWWSVSILSFDLLVLGFFVMNFTSYSLATVKTVSSVYEMSAPLVGPELRRYLTPQPLQIGEAVAVALGGDRFDLIAPIRNLNSSLAAVKISYHFSDGVETSDEITLLMPAAAGFLTQFNVTLSPGASRDAVRAVVTNIEWLRPPNTQMLEDVQFKVNDAALRSVTGLTGGRTATRMSATVKNASVYSFKRVRFVVVLRHQARIIEAGDAIVENFRTFEDRQIEVNWLQSLPLSAEVIVVPEVNIFDRSSFL